MLSHRPFISIAEWLTVNYTFLFFRLPKAKPAKRNAVNPTGEETSEANFATGELGLFMFIEGSSMLDNVVPPSETRKKPNS